MAHSFLQLTEIIYQFCISALMISIECCCFELYYHRSNQFLAIENSLTTLKVFKPKKLLIFP